MEKNQFLKGITFLGIAYNKEFTAEQVDVWFDFFANDSYDNFRNAVKRIIPKNQFMPSIAEIKQEIALLENQILQLDIDEEWQSVITAIRKFGYYKQGEAIKSLNPHTANIVQTIGWNRLCSSENIEWERKTFKEMFNNKQDRFEEIAVLDKPKYTLSELSRIAKAKALETEEPLLIEEK